MGTFYCTINNVCFIVKVKQVQHDATITRHVETTIIKKNDYRSYAAKIKIKEFQMKEQTHNKIAEDSSLSL